MRAALDGVGEHGGGPCDVVVLALRPQQRLQIGLFLAVQLACEVRGDGDAAEARQLRGREEQGGERGEGDEGGGEGGRQRGARVGAGQVAPAD